MMEDHARKAGSIPSGSYRVVVIESDLGITIHDCASLDDAKSYADDCCSEAESDTPPVAWVFDENFKVVHYGRAYNLPTAPCP